MVKIFEINLLLSSLYKLKNNENCVKIEFVKQKYEQEYFVEMMAPYEDVIMTASKLGFIEKEIEFIKLTTQGEDFIQNGRETSLNSTRKQRLFLENLLIKSELFLREFQKIFLNFKIDFSGEIPTYRGMIRKSNEKTTFLELFRDMGIFDSNEDGLFIPIKKNHIISFLKNKRYFKKTNYEELNKKKSEIGKIGEELTMKFELKRLENYGELSHRIDHVSEYDDSAGFDICSFENGNSDKDEHDKFIEVKATTDSKPHFFLSMNEIEIASHKKSKYWIYLWTDIFKEKPKLTTIKDPYTQIFEISKIEPTPVSYYISKNLIENLDQQEIINEY